MDAFTPHADQLKLAHVTTQNLLDPSVRAVHAKGEDIEGLPTPQGKTLAEFAVSLAAHGMFGSHEAVPVGISLTHAAGQARRIATSLAVQRS